VSPLSSEIVGLVPKKALEDAAEWFLQVENFDSSLILENRLAAVMGGKMAVGGSRAGVNLLWNNLRPGSDSGSGSASAAAGAMAAGLAQMVAGMSRGKKAYLQYEAQLSEAIASLSSLREELKASIDADAEAYNQVMKGLQSGARDPEGGNAASSGAAIDAALKQATLVPLAVAERPAEVGRIAASLGAVSNPNMKSDLTTAGALARAAVEGALANVEINLESLKDQGLPPMLERGWGA